MGNSEEIKINLSLVAGSDDNGFIKLIKVPTFQSGRPYDKRQMNSLIPHLYSYTAIFGNKKISKRLPHLTDIHVLISTAFNYSR